MNNPNQFNPIPQNQPTEQPLVPPAEQPAYGADPAPAQQPIPQETAQPVPGVDPAPAPVQPAFVPPQNGVARASSPATNSANPTTEPAPYPPVWQPFLPQTAPAKKKNKGLRITAGILAGVMALIVCVSGGYLAGRKDGQNLAETPASSPSQNQAGSNDNTASGEKSQFDVTTGDKGDASYSYEQIVETVSQSIVNITVYAADGSAGSYASGIIMDAKQGYVLTNDHIYAEVPNAKFLITLNNKTEFKATFVSGDTRSDIAILKIENPKNLTAATFSTTPVTVGERVLAIGQSYGYADTVSEGIVSAANRRVSLQSGSYSEQYIQTTAAINPGNSGGALVNMAGQVVGVTSAKIASQEVEGLGFAIPSEKALSIVKNLQENGKVKGRAKLGITYTEMNTVAAEVNDCPVGIYVQSVDDTLDVGKKGIKEGDVITHVNGKEITMSTVLLDIIETAKAGDTLKLTVYSTKTKTSKTVNVTLAEAESTNSYQTASQNSQEQSQGNDLPENPFDYYFDDFNN